jgi:hypothetical protein
MAVGRVVSARGSDSARQSDDSSDWQEPTAGECSDSGEAKTHLSGTTSHRRTMSGNLWKDKFHKAEQILGAYLVFNWI